MEREHSPSSPAENPNAERALERLSSGWIPQDSAPADSGDVEIREHLEALALFAYDLEPEAPRPAVKQQLMARIQASAQSSAAGTDNITSMPQRSPVDMTLQHSVAGGLDYQADAAEKTLVGAGADVVPLRPPEHRSEPRGSAFVPWSLAAALAFCLIGLGYLYGQVNAKNVVIGMQQERLESAQTLEIELERTRSDLARMQDSLAMVATVAQTAYPLRPATAVPVAVGRPAPRGKVFVCGQHQRWYLSLNDLEPAPEGQEYHLWFLTKDGMVDAGKFEVENGLAAMRDLNMPDGTQGFEITLEPAGGGGEATGQPIMIGDRPVSL